MYIKEHFGVYTVSGLHKWLHRNGYSYKKPKGLQHKADAQLQQEFIQKYNELKQLVGEEELILFMDSVHPTQATKLSYGWIKTGKTKHVGTTASRTRLNIIGAVQLGHIAEAITAQEVRNNRFFKGAKDFKEAINGFFNTILPSIGNNLNGRINDNFQLLNS